MLLLISSVTAKTIFEFSFIFKFLAEDIYTSVVVFDIIREGANKFLI